MLKRALIALLIAAAALALIDWASSLAIPCPAQPVVQSTSGQEEQHKPSHKSCAVSGIIVQGLALIWNTVSDWKPEIWTAFATIAIACFTLVLAIATYVQAGLTRQTIMLSERTLRSVERAFVFLRDIESTARFSDSAVSGWRFTPVWENSGSTPTKHMTAHVCATVRDINPPRMDPSGGDLPDNFMFPDTLACAEIDAFAPGPNSYVMGPRSALYGESIEIHVVTLDHIRNRRKRGFIWGWADYNDTIGGTIRHRTEFCREILVPHDPSIRGEMTIRFRTYRRHNGADDECLRPPGSYVAPQ